MSFEIAFCKMFLFKTRPISCKHWVAVASSPRGSGGAQVTSHLRRQQKQLKGTVPLKISFFCFSQCLLNTTMIHYNLLYSWGRRPLWWGPLTILPPNLVLRAKRGARNASHTIARATKCNGAKKMFSRTVPLRIRQKFAVMIG